MFMLSTSLLQDVLGSCLYFYYRLLQVSLSSLVCRSMLHPNPFYVYYIKRLSSFLLPITPVLPRSRSALFKLTIKELFNADPMSVLFLCIFSSALHCGSILKTFAFVTGLHFPNLHHYFLITNMEFSLDTCLLQISVLKKLLYHTRKNKSETN